ncbi:MAG TPA: hypothetical protein VGK50_08955 [Coriobacteriia bacterium]|jgi:hypothetical protein
MVDEHLKNAPGRTLRAVSASLAALVLGGTLATATPARAAFNSPGDFNRAQVAMRADQWVKDSPYYSQTDWYHGYRQDCSGFVSMAWGLGDSYVTWTLPDVAWPIHKSDLTLGDIMLNTADHVVLFDRWANPQQTAYWEWELAGSTNRPVHRVVPYPFWTSDRDNYKPYRFAVASRYTGKQPPRPPLTVKAMLSQVASASAPATTAAPAANPQSGTAAKPATKSAAAPKVRPRQDTPRREAAVDALTAAPAGKRPARAVRDRAEQTTLQEPLVLVLLRDLVAWLAQ